MYIYVMYECDILWLRDVYIIKNDVCIFFHVHENYRTIYDIAITLCNQSAMADLTRPSNFNYTLIWASLLQEGAGGHTPSVTLGKKKI